MGINLERIQSNKYFDIVKVYFVDHKDPAMVYAFLLNKLWEDKYILSQKMYYERVDTLKVKDNCILFYTGTKCDLELWSNPENRDFTK